ncbi:MAG: hypothetical protein OK454_01045 [Thaumarchaeota archaeon]|nr:hypothetical protein [Nitrososphaerota archaeon]
MRYVNRNRWKGETVVTTVRLAKPIREFMESAVDGEDLRNVSECLQEAAFLWCYMIERENA